MSALRPVALTVVHGLHFQPHPKAEQIARAAASDRRHTLASEDILDDNQRQMLLRAEFTWDPAAGRIFLVQGPGCKNNDFRCMVQQKNCQQAYLNIAFVARLWEHLHSTPGAGIPKDFWVWPGRSYDAAPGWSGAQDTALQVAGGAASIRLVRLRSASLRHAPSASSTADLSLLFVWFAAYRTPGWVGAF